MYHISTMIFNDTTIAKILILIKKKEIFEK